MGQQVTLDILVPAKDGSFVSQYEARLALGLTSSTDETLDDQIEMFIKWSSDEITTACGRFFAKETLVETFRDVNDDNKRVWLSHYPIDNVASVVVASGTTLVEDVDYEVDYNEGKIYRIGTTWESKVVVTYTGGYDLPFECPPALQQAAVLLVREAYYAARRGDASIKMVAHKGSRVMYFDPNAKSNSGGGSAARKSIESLLQAYTRYEI